MQPEISRRCSSCGASARDAEALFCAECGGSLSKDASPAAPLAEAPAPGPADHHSVESHPHRIAGRTRETLHRASVVASAAARGVIEEPAKRVEQIRHVSSTMIEEASYDPSLRFVLVALGLFVVFIILLVLSKVMG